MSRLIVLMVLVASSAWAGEADVIEARVAKTADLTYRFEVTVKHADTGWDHYANKWDLLGPDDTILGTRVLLHSHVAEQPFTRSLGGINVPKGIESVTVRAHDSVHGYGGEQRTVKIPR